MIDNTQEPRDLIQICTDIYYECGTIKRLDELTDEALDWHNKQIEEVLDRLLEYGEDFTTFGDGSRSVAVAYIEAERNKLKESKRL